MYNYKMFNFIFYFLINVIILSTSKYIVIIRTHYKLNNFKKSLFKEYSIILQNEKLYDLYFLYEKKNNDRIMNEDILYMNDLKNKHKKTNYFVYNEKDIKKKIPSFNPKIPNRKIKIFNPINYYYHIPSVILLLKKLKENNFYEGIWVFEDDARFNGNIKEFLSFYEKKDFDYITSNVINIEEMDKNWWALNLTTWNLKISYRKWKSDHVQMYSLRFLNFIEQLLYLNIISMEESYEATICGLLPWCKMHAMNEDNFVGYKYSWVEHIYKDEWKNNISNNPINKNKWFHGYDDNN